MQIICLHTFKESVVLLFLTDHLAAGLAKAVVALPDVWRRLQLEAKPCDFSDYGVPRDAHELGDLGSRKAVINVSPEHCFLCIWPSARSGNWLKVELSAVYRNCRGGEAHVARGANASEALGVKGAKLFIVLRLPFLHRLVDGKALRLLALHGGTMPSLPRMLLMVNGLLPKARAIALKLWPAFHIAIICSQVSGSISCLRT